MSPAFDPSSSPAAAESAASPSAAASQQSPAEGTERGNGGNAAGKKPAWNVPMNGASEGGAVMGADSWPALSAKVFPKSSSASEPPKDLANGPNPPPAGSVIATPRPKPNSYNPDPSSSPSLAVPARQKPNPKPNSMKRGSDGGGCSSSGFPANGAPASPQPPFTLEETTPVGLEVGPEASPKDLPKGNGNWGRNQGGGFTPQHHGRGDHRGGYNGNRRGNNGSGIPHHGGYGKWQDHEWGGYDWNAPRGFSSRDPYMPVPLPQQRGNSRPFIRPPPPAPAPFISMPLQVRPFVGPMGYSGVPSVYYVPAPPPFEQLRNVPFVAHQVPPAISPTVYLTPVDHQRAMLAEQIEYYFSSENLCRDIFLRQKMDDQGWVSITLIAGFNRVKLLTNDIPYILDTVRGSTVVEVQGEKIRRRNDWMNWILPPTSKQHGIDSLPQSLATSECVSLALHVQNLGLDEGASCQNSTRGQTNIEAVFSRSASGNLNNQMLDGDPVERGKGKSQAKQNQIDPSH